MIVETLFAGIPILLVVLILAIAFCTETDPNQSDDKVKEKSTDGDLENPGKVVEEEEKHEVHEEEEVKEGKVEEEDNNDDDDDENDFSSLAEISENVKYLVLAESNKDAQQNAQRKSNVNESSELSEYTTDDYTKDSE